MIRLIINNDALNTIANITNLGIVTKLLGYNQQNYELNKKSYEINKYIAENNNKDLIDVLNHICTILECIKDDLDIIIEKNGE